MPCICTISQVSSDHSHALSIVIDMIGMMKLVWIKNDHLEVGEMAQWLRALDALPEVLRSNPSNHMVAHNHL